MIDSTYSYQFYGASDSVLLSKEIREYQDSAGSMKIATIYNWEQTTDNWTPDSRQKTFIAPDKLFRADEYFLWDTLSKCWTGWLKEEWDYLEPLRYETGKARYDWDSVLGDWRPVEMYGISYDEYMNDTLRSTCSWDTVLSSWNCIDREKIVNSYDSTGYLTGSIHHIPFEEGWNNSKMFEFSYDSAGNRTVQIEFHWNNTLEVWDPDNKLISEYDSLNQEVYMEFFSWEPDSTWRNTIYAQIMYDSGGNIAEWYSCHQIISGRPWQCSRYVYENDPYGSRIRSDTYRREGEEGDWIPNIKEVFFPGNRYYNTYDSICRGESLNWEEQYLVDEGNYQKIFTSVVGTDSVRGINLSYLPSPGPYMISGEDQVEPGQVAYYNVQDDHASEYIWNSENGRLLGDSTTSEIGIEWDSAGTGVLKMFGISDQGCSSDTSTLLVSIGASGLEEGVVTGFTLYPVPVKDWLYVESNLKPLMLEVVDLHGRLVVQSTSNKINLSGLSSGFYIVRVKDIEGAIRIVRKISKQ